jgi:hypothetical protein
MSFKVRLPPEVNNAGRGERLSYPPKTGGSGDRGDVQPLASATRSHGIEHPQIVPRRNQDYDLLWNDPYWRLATNAVKRLGELNWPFGLASWLEKNDASFYRHLYTCLPEEINRAWDAAVPVEQFQAILDRWVGGHRDALKKYGTEFLQDRNSRS